MFKRIVMLLCSALLLTILPATADQRDKKTIVTFARPVELPGIVLPAGKYVFRLYESDSNRHVVRVFNADETKVFTTILAIPNWRLTPTEKSVMPFEERPRGNPEALRAWFYPGDGFGQEFVYPKNRAFELAETARVPVLTGAVTPTEKPEELIKEPVTAVTPEKEEVELAQVTQRPQVQIPPLIAQAAPQTPLAAPPELPKTASPLPLLMLVGLCSLGIAVVLRAISKRIA